MFCQPVRRLAMVVVCAFLASSSQLLAEGGASSLGEAIREGKFSLALRYRFESVRDDARPKIGRASTLRTVLAFRTKPLGGASAYIELEDVTGIGLGDQHDNAGFGDLANEQTDRAIIADPALTEINQAYLRWELSEAAKFTLGRQEILRGNERFVGNVGWRQNHQSFDAVQVKTELIPRTTAAYVYVRNANRIDGANAGMDSHLIDFEIALNESSSVFVYGYKLDFDATAELSTWTMGARYDGTHAIGERAKVLVDAELAQQDDAGENPGKVDAGYWRADIGVDLGRVTVRVGRETLEGGSGEGRFTTPLATLHKWNGWADKFVTTPANGLVDTLAAVAGRVGKVELAGVWHDFESDTGGESFGSEIDLLATYTAPWKQSFGFKAALYDADGHAADTNKFMLWTAWGF